MPNKIKIRELGSQTKAIHGGYKSRLSEGAVMPPNIDTTTFSFPNAEAGEEAFKEALSGKRSKHLIYSRVNHPDACFVEDRFVGIEPGASDALVFSSGMAAITTTILACLADKEEKMVHYTSPVYGGTYCFFHQVLPYYGVKVKTINTESETDFFNVFESRSLGIVYIETPANPTMRLWDINKIARKAKLIDPSCVVVVDNTFLGVFQNPLLLSRDVDVVVYSATKFISGYSDVLAGLVVTKDAGLTETITSYRTVLGNILCSASCKTLLRSLPSYEDRMHKQADNAVRIINFLWEQNVVRGIVYPGIERKGTVNPLGSVIAIYLHADKQKTFKFLNTVSKTGVISLAVSLGGVETLITHPATTTHSEMSPDELKANGITDNLVRLSVGLENIEDIIDLLAKGLKVLK